MKRKEPPTKQQQPLRLLVCDDLGVVKGVQAPGLHLLQDAKVASKWGQPDRGQNSAQCLTVYSSSHGEGGAPLVAVGRVSGKVSLLNGHTGQPAGEISAASISGSDEADRSICSLHFLRPREGSSGLLRLLSCTHSGLVRIHEARPSGDDGAPGCSWHSTAEWSVPKEVKSTAVDEDEGHLAVGCKGTELTVWDLGTQQRTYLAKSSKPDRVGLVDPPWCTVVAFLPGTSATKVVVGTGKHKLRLYDTHFRRPVLQMDWGEARITALAPEPNGVRVWVGNAAGKIEAVDLNKARTVGALRGATGSARALALHPGAEPVLATVGLDRFLRLHSTATRRQLAAVYLKQKLTGVAFCPPPPPPSATAEEGAGAELAAGGAGERERKKRKKKATQE